MGACAEGASIPSLRLPEQGRREEYPSATVCAYRPRGDDGQEGRTR